MKKSTQSEQEIIVLRVLLLMAFIMIGIFIYGELIELVHSIGESIGSFLAGIL